MSESVNHSYTSLQLEQACKDANIALTLGIISIYASTLPLLGIVTALVAERLAYRTPDIPAIKNVQTKKNIIHFLTPITFLLSILCLTTYYLAWKHSVHITFK